MATTEGVDLSRLQPHTPLRTLHLSLVDLMKYVSVGTSELLLYLLKETHVILECRACSNLFRDVPYLVAHKRFYCTQTYDFSLQNHGNSKGPPQGDLAAFFQAESPLNEEDFLKHSVELAKKNLQNSQVENYVRKEPTKRQFFDAVQKQLELTRATSPKTRSYSFEPMENTNIAMKVISTTEDSSSQQGSTECEGCLHSKEFDDKNDAQNNVDSNGEKFNRSASSSSISSMSSSSQSSDNKNNTSSEYKSLHCFKCNLNMPSQKAMSDHMLAVHPEERRRPVHSCGNFNHTSPYGERLNGMQNKVRKTDWLKPKGFVSAEEKIPPKPPVVYNPAKEALEAKKKAQANLLALKEEQLAYENEILQQKLIRGIIPKSSRGRKKFRCESCGKIFSKMNSLRDHLRDCIDWEHVSQPIRPPLRLPLPASGDGNGPSLPMSAPASVDWQDNSNDEPPPKPPTPVTQYRPLAPKPENPRVHTVSSIPVVQPLDKLPIKLQNLNGVNKNIVENPARGQVLVMNPKIRENKPILLPLSNTNLTISPQTPSPVEIYPKLIRIGDPSVLKSQLLPANLHISHNNGNNSNNMMNITGGNAQIVTPINHGSLGSAVGNEVKDVEIIAINPPNTVDKTIVNLQNNKPQSTVLNVSVNSREQVNPLPCDCLQCEAGAANLDNPVNVSSPTPSPTGCRDCDECQKGSICSSACCMKDVEIVEQFTSLPPEGSNIKYSLSNCGFQQQVPTNDADDVIITSHNFTRPEPKQNIMPMVLVKTEKGPLNLQGPKQNNDNPDECVLISISNEKPRIPDVPISVRGPLYPVPIPTSGKEPAYRSFMKPVIWKQYKCKFCIFSHESFMGCKLHVKKKHAHKIRNCDVQCINHYVVDLKCRDKRICCSFPGKRCKQTQNPKLNSVSTTGPSSIQNVTPQLGDTSSVVKSPPSPQPLQTTRTVSKTDKKDIQDLMDIKKRQCLECKHKFQTVFNLQRHVVRHLGRKDFQCKSCSRTMYSSSECRSHIKRDHLGKVKGITLKTLDLFIIDLRNQQTVSGNDKDNSDNSSHMSMEVDSNVTAPSRNHPKVAQLSVLSTRKGSYQKPELLLDSKAKSAKKIIKK